MKSPHYLTIILFFSLFSCKKEVLPPVALLPVPNEYQLKWQEMEQYAFIHFTTNTFTGKEWGYGDEKPDVFNPSDFDPEQWVLCLKEAGLKGLILTCKHHDGFCLWPSKYTEHSIRNSPYKNGQGDIVKEVSDACKKHGLPFGIYLSPWDRNRPEYGKPEYLTYYRNQLQELLENYGPVFEIWFDGANGGDGYYGGVRELRKIDNTVYYDWKNTQAIVRSISPEAMMFSDAGPDIRWCGNEKGFAGDPNWCIINSDTLHPGKAGIGTLLNQGSEDGTSWIPSEVDVSIRPGWFYHPEEDSLVRIPDNLFKIYLESVGRGANLLLNIPPDQRGLLHDNDIQSLKAWKKMRDEAFAVNLAAGVHAVADTYRKNSTTYAAKNVTDGDKNTYWATDDGQLTGFVEIDLGEAQKIHYVLLQEYIRLGQRVKSFDIEVKTDDQWVKVAEGTTIGHKRILSLPESGISARCIRIHIRDARACPLISNIEVY